MKRITISLTDDELLDLEHHAANERRSVREMAAYLVVKNTPARPTIGGLTFVQQGIPNVFTYPPSGGTLNISGSSTTKVMN